MPGALGGSGLISSGGYLPNSSSSFPDPFMDMASLAMPETMLYALRWVEYLTFANGTLARALDRIVSYFITRIELMSKDEDGIDDDEREDILNYLYDIMGIMDELHIGAMNFMVYGNEFMSVLVPFRRYISCAKCHLEVPLREAYNTPEFAFKWQDLNFNASCPKCQYSGIWSHVDRRSESEGKLRIKHWSPHEVDLLWDPYTDDVRYIWKIPDDYRRVLREGHLHHLERANWEIVEAVRQNRHLLFDPDVMYHMKEPTLAGIRNRGWGISRILANFRQAWYVQVLHRYNEAIALDYVIPFRVITPAPGPGSGDSAKDSLLNMNMGGYMSQIQRMLRQRRRDPSSWHTLPFPVQYQALGGDATQLAPRELLDQGIEVLLNNTGVPVELYKGSLQVQAAVPALRLFESQWSHLVQAMNGMLNFIMKKVGLFMSWDKLTARLQKVTHADDMERQMAKLQLFTGGQISRDTGLQPLGIDWREEIRKQMNEQEYQADQQAKSTERMQQKSDMESMGQPPQMGGTPGGPAGAGGSASDPAMMQGGQPGMQGGQGGGIQGQGPQAQAGQQAWAGQQTIPGKPTTPEEVLAKAQTIAQQLMGLPDTQRKSELLQLKKSDPMLHAQVKELMDSMKQQAQTAGGAMMIQQQYGKQGSAQRLRRNTPSLAAERRYIDL
jgi:hypothetical protein